MKNKDFLLLIFSLTLLCCACTKNNDRLFNEFGLNKEHLSKVTTILENKAVVIDCSLEEFKKFQQQFYISGFNDWHEFHGIVGVDNITIFNFVSRKLLYSCKFIKGSLVKHDIYSPVAVYDRQYKKLYLVMASDLGG